MPIPLLQKGKSAKSAGKVMLSVFWDSHGVILTDYLPKGQTITGTYYSNLPDKLRAALKNKHLAMLSRVIHFLAENAPTLSSQISVDKERACGFEIVQHPPYSPDLAPSDFF